MYKLDARKENLYYKILIGTIAVASIAFITIFLNYSLALFNSEHIRSSTPMVIVLMSVLILCCFYYLLRKKHSGLSAYLFLLTLFSLGVINSLYWGADVPIAYLIYTLTIVIAGIIIGSNFGLFMMSLVCITLIIISYLQGIGLLKYDGYWLASPPSIIDGLTAAIIFSLIALISWLSNREIEASLSRAETSEKALLLERDQLEIRVKERTKELQKAQLEKMLHLYRFADFGRLAAGLIHDIVNPLTVVSLNLEQIHTSSTKRKSLQTLRRAIARATDGTKRIEDYVEAARRHIQRQDINTQFNLSAELQSVIKLFSYRSRKEQVGIELACPSNITLTGNPIKLSQAFSNLISNALDAHQSSIKSSTKTNKFIKIKAHKKNQSCIVELTDNAGGIKREDLPHIFKPFYTTKDAGKGTGIGLAITKDIIQKTFKGKIAVASLVNKGTTFTIELPA